jgi:RNase P/RNase MRP subunit POP5
VQILQEARAAAFEILQEDPLLKKSENKVLREELLKSHGATALAGIA